MKQDSVFISFNDHIPGEPDLVGYRSIFLLHS